MSKYICVAVALMFFSLITYAQVAPAPNAKLHYRVIPFELPIQTNTNQYSISIAKGIYTDEVLFKKNIIVRKSDTSSRIVATVPSFATDYTWQWSCKKNGKTINSSLYHFATLRYPYTDSQGNLSTRMNVTKKSTLHKGDAILVDCTRTLYDIDGNPLWFVPESLCPEMTQGSVQDLKITKDGTFTFIYNAQAYEINYKGDLLTKITSSKLKGIENDVFHHDLTKLDNGNFMVLGSEMYFYKYSNYENRIATNAQDSAEIFRHINMGTIHEFDAIGNLVWQWSSLDYFKKSDLAVRIKDKNNNDIEFHLNAFYFNKLDNTLYLGFRNISRIIKLKYPLGDVVKSYGNDYDPQEDINKNDLFCYQHSIVSNEINKFYVYNNNACNIPSFPELIYYSEESNGFSSLKELKKFMFTGFNAVQQSTEGLSARTGRKAAGNRGGSFNLLANNQYFVSLNAPYSNIVILDENGTYLWVSIIENYETGIKQWKPKPTYRSNFVSNKDLKLILLSKDSNKK